MIENLKEAKFTGKKLEQKTYYRHTGHPGGLKATKLNKMLAEKPNRDMEKAVYNMIPKKAILFIKNR